MELLTQPTRKRAVASLNSDSDKQFADPCFGELLPLSVAMVESISSPTTQRIFTPQSWTGWTSIKAGIGNGFVAPVAGAYYIRSGIALTSGTVTNNKRYVILTYVAGDVFTNIGAASNASGVEFTSTGTTPTTWVNGSTLQEITANLAYNASAAALETALNATAWITAAGGVLVDTEGGLYFFVTFNTDGTRTQMVGFAEELAPLSLIDVGTLIDGTTTLAEVQTIRIFQNVGTFALLTDDSDAPDITLTEVTVGGAGLNAKWRVTLGPTELPDGLPPYAGYFSLILRGVETALLPYNATAAQVVTALEGLSLTSGLLVSGAKYKIVTYVASDVFTNVGAGSNATGVVFVASGTTPTTWTNGSTLSPVASGNVSVALEAAGQWLISFIGNMANTAMGTMTADDSALTGVEYKSGSLNLDTDGIALLLGDETSVATYLAITAIAPGETTPQELCRIPVTLNAAIIDPAMSVPTPRLSFYTTTQVDALLAVILSGGNLLIGTKARLVPITNGFKIQVSTDGAAWQDAASYVAS